MFENPQPKEFQNRPSAVRDIGQNLLNAYTGSLKRDPNCMNRTLVREANRTKVPRVVASQLLLCGSLISVIAGLQVIIHLSAGISVMLPAIGAVAAALIAISSFYLYGRMAHKIQGKVDAIQSNQLRKHHKQIVKRFDVASILTQSAAYIEEGQKILVNESMQPSQLHEAYTSFDKRSAPLRRTLVKLDRKLQHLSGTCYAQDVSELAGVIEQWSNVVLQHLLTLTNLRNHVSLKVDAKLVGLHDAHIALLANIEEDLRIFDIHLNKAKLGRDPKRWFSVAHVAFTMANRIDAYCAKTQALGGLITNNDHKRVNDLSVMSQQYRQLGKELEQRAEQE